MCDFGYNFLQLHFSLPRVRCIVELYWGKVDLTIKDEDITNFISSNLN